jgi:hypothetical protein
VIRQVAPAANRAAPAAASHAWRARSWRWAVQRSCTSAGGWSSNSGFWQ